MPESTSDDSPCLYPGCTSPRPPRNKRSGHQAKFCLAHRQSGINRPGGPVDPTSKVRVHCTRCGIEFEKYRKLVAKNKTGHHFCSAACRNSVGSKGRRGSYRTCEVCEGLFYARESSRRVTCSVDCGNAYKARNQVRMACEGCGGEFVVHAKGAAARRFCSLECSGHVNTKIAMTCEWCSAEYIGRPQEGRRFCSKPCFYAWQTANASGSIDSNGYRLITDENGKYRVEHRVVMERVLGRKLKANERVHHLNADRQNNDPTNLLLMISEAHPAGAAIGDLIESLERRVRELRRDRRKLEEVGAGTTIRDSHTAYKDPDPLTLFDDAG